MWSRRKTPTVTLGGKKIEVNPLNIRNAVELTLLMAPYWPILDQHLPNLEHALMESDRPLLVGIFTVLRQEMAQMPGDTVKAVALLVGVEPEWIAKNATAAELVAALPTLDRVHDFGRLWRLLKKGSAYLGK